MSAIRQISLEFDPYLPWQRGMLNGIEAFAREVPEWRLLRHRMIPGSRIWLKDSENRIDGMLSNDERIWAEKNNIPLVRFSARNPEPAFPVVEVDYMMVGRLAAQNLMENGYTRLAVLETNEPNPQDRTRGKGFCQTVEEQQADLVTIPINGNSITELLNDESATKALARRIRALGKPVGLFARNLGEAYVLHSLLHDMGLSIPDEVGLIVGGNDREMLEYMDPPLTSISRNSYQIGYTASAILKRMLDGEAVEALTIVQPVGVVDRGSTRLRTLGDRVVQQARSVIRGRTGEAINIDELARELGVSGRSLRRRFQATLKHSPVREIQLARLDMAKDLLANSRASILEIAHRCGFAESCQLSTFFKKETGQTPTGFRHLTFRPDR